MKDMTGTGLKLHYFTSEYRLNVACGGDIFKSAGTPEVRGMLECYPTNPTRYIPCAECMATDEFINALYTVELGELTAAEHRAMQREAEQASFAPCRTCASCGGSAHVASGCEYSPTMLICGRCIREAWRWIRGHTQLEKRVGAKGVKGAKRVSFYEAAALNRPKDLGV